MGSGKSLGLTNVPSVNIAIDGSTLGIGCKQLSVDNAAVTLTGKQLILSGTYTPAAGEVFTIVSAPTGITGTFNGLADGDTITFNDRSLVIHYTETAVTLTDAAPVVTSNPSPIGVNNGNVVTFSASASGIPAPSVHWQVNTGSGFVDMVPAQTSSTLTFTANTSQNGYQYRAVFTNTSGTATTTGALLSVYKTSTTTTIASSANPSTYGDLVTFTATVTSGATGTVTFMDGATVLGTDTLSGGSASLSTSALSIGTHGITAIYSGNTNYLTSTSSVLNQVVNTNGSDTTTTLASSANPSTYGDIVVFTATVTSGATGTVTFKDGSTVLGTGTLSGGTASFSTSLLSVGNHSITAIYEGDANYATSTSSALTQVVDQIATTTAVVSSANPSTFGNSVTFTATVTSGATGTVTFRDGATVLATESLSGNTATYSTTSLAAGLHNITAQYNGDSNYASSIAGLTQTVTAAPVVVTNPTNQSVDIGGTCTFTASATGYPTPSVQWQISVNGGAWANIAGATSASYTIAPVTLSSDGTRYRAVFTNTAGSAATGIALLRVNQSPTVTLNPSDVSTNAGSIATFTAGASGWPAPSVQWQINQGAGWNDIPGATALSYTTGSLGSGDNGNKYQAVFTNTFGTVTTSSATLTIASVASITNVAVGWGTKTANLADASSGRLLPSGRMNTIPWLGIQTIVITLDQAITGLNASDISLRGASTFSYSVMGVAGSGSTWTITLASGGLINNDRVTLQIGGSTIATYTRRLDVLPGDVNDDAIVTSLDQLLTQQAISAGYNIFRDVDGSGAITSTDINLIKARLGRRLP